MTLIKYLRVFFFFFSKKIWLIFKMIFSYSSYQSKVFKTFFWLKSILQFFFIFILINIFN